MSCTMVGDEGVGRAELEKALRTYALRVARKCFLQFLCPEDHPVLEVEIQLVEMAKSKLHEQILISVSGSNLGKTGPIIESRIRHLARLRVSHLADAEDVRDNVLYILESEQLDVCPSVH